MSLTSEGSSWRVLVVDDEPDNLNLARDVLTFTGATVAVTGRAQKALDMIREFAPNLILLDLSMPEMDGWEVHELLRAQRDFDHIPIIALTALAMPQDAERVMAAGFDGYITKPFLIRSLIADIKGCIEKFREKHPQAEAKPPDAAPLATKSPEAVASEAKPPQAPSPAAVAPEAKPSEAQPPAAVAPQAKSSEAQPPESPTPEKRDPPT